MRDPRIAITHLDNELTKFLQAQKFINAYAAFLKRQGKLPMYVPRCPTYSAMFANNSQSRFVSIQRVMKSLNPVNGG